MGRGAWGPRDVGYPDIPRARRGSRARDGLYSAFPRLAMWLLYLLAIVLGGGSLLIQVLSGGDHAHDHDFGGPDHPDGPGLLSTRSVVYGLFTFGFVGALLHVPGLVEPGTALAALRRGRGREGA